MPQQAGCQEKQVILSFILFSRSLDTKPLLARRTALKNMIIAPLVSEGLKNKEGNFISEQGLVVPGHKQQWRGQHRKTCERQFGYKYPGHSDYLQRSARHIASKTDVEQLRRRKAAVEMALAGKNAIMPIIGAKIWHLSL